MARGRPSKSKRTKDLQGTSRKDREAKSSALPVSTGKLGIPKGLSRTVKRHCSNLAKYLKDAGIPANLVRGEFGDYCKCRQLADDAYKELRSGKGKAAKAFKDNSDQALRIAKYFETLLRKATPPKKSKLSALEKFKNEGKQLGVVEK